MLESLGKFLFMCLVAVITVSGGISTGNAAGNVSQAVFSEQKTPLLLASAMQMPEENNTNEHDENHMHTGHEEMPDSENETHAMMHQQTDQSADMNEAHNHPADNEANEMHEHHHDDRTTGKPGEGPNWPFIEAIFSFNILVIVFAGFMKWKKKEKLQ